MSLTEAQRREVLDALIEAQRLGKITRDEFAAAVKAVFA